MKGGLSRGHFFTDFVRRFNRTWHSSRLPTHGLPLAVALEECSGVQIVRNRDLLVLLGCSNQSERDDRSIAVLLNANVFGAIGDLRITGLRRRRRAHAAHDIRLADPPP